MLENLRVFLKKMGRKENEELLPSSSDAAKERLHLVLIQDRANVSVDFIEMMKQEILNVIKKYVDIDEKEMDVRLTNQINEDGSNGAPALYANIPIVGIKAEKNQTEVFKEQSEVDKNDENNIEIKEKTRSTRTSNSESNEVKAKKKTKNADDIKTVRKSKEVVDESSEDAATKTRAHSTKNSVVDGENKKTRKTSEKKLDKNDSIEENNSKKVTRTRKTTTAKKESVSK